MRGSGGCLHWRRTWLENVVFCSIILFCWKMFLIAGNG